MYLWLCALRLIMPIPVLGSEALQERWRSKESGSARLRARNNPDRKHHALNLWREFRESFSRLLR